MLHASKDRSLAISRGLCAQHMMHRASGQCSCITNEMYGSFLLTMQGCSRGMLCLMACSMPYQVHDCSDSMHCQGRQEMCLRHEVPEVAGR